ncbi:MAG: hypothetical protein H0U23_02440 [Blastocatellia bacterium]|jgi:hypothetical protein|nr:hypothetical protein [Blastocatellia bacterium]MDQ3120781.1 hypothetical protein [Verrucomicrobiota bacterium]
MATRSEFATESVPFAIAFVASAIALAAFAIAFGTVSIGSAADALESASISIASVTKAIEFAAISGAKWDALEQILEINAFGKFYAEWRCRVRFLVSRDFRLKAPIRPGGGNPILRRNVLITALNHMHEHLGQSIACARMNNVVPPWTAAEQAGAKAKPEK